MRRTERRGARALGTAVIAISALLAPMRAVAAQGPDSVSHVAMPPHTMSWGKATYVLSEVLEYAAQESERPVLFDLLGWVGGSTHRLWFKADGSAATRGRAVHGEYQVLYGRLVAPFWDAQIGLRADARSSAAPSASRLGAVLGFQGLAPGWFELEPSLFVTTTGAISLDLTASYDLYLTQRLVLQPRLESSVSSRDEPEFGIGKGLSGTSFGLRTRYEFRREFAPYVGIVFEREFGRSAELARLAGGSARSTLLVSGLRLWW
jgi:copper resistance protein B